MVSAKSSHLGLAVAACALVSVQSLTALEKLGVVSDHQWVWSDVDKHLLEYVIEKAGDDKPSEFPDMSNADYGKLIIRTWRNLRQLLRQSLRGVFRDRRKVIAETAQEDGWPTLLRTDVRGAIDSAKSAAKTETRQEFGCPSNDPKCAWVERFYGNFEGAVFPSLYAEAAAPTRHQHRRLGVAMDETGGGEKLIAV